jgi:hypothetical protein
MKSRNRPEVRVARNRREVTVCGRFADAGCVGDITHAGRVDAFLREERRWQEQTDALGYLGNLSYRQSFGQPSKNPKDTGDNSS